MQQKGNPNHFMTWNLTRLFILQVRFYSLYLGNLLNFHLRKKENVVYGADTLTLPVYEATVTPTIDFCSGFLISLWWVLQHLPPLPLIWCLYLFLCKFVCCAFLPLKLLPLTFLPLNCFTLTFLPLTFYYCHYYLWHFYLWPFYLAMKDRSCVRGSAFQRPVTLNWAGTWCQSVGSCGPQTKPAGNTYNLPTKQTNTYRDAVNITWESGLGIGLSTWKSLFLDR